MSTKTDDLFIVTRIETIQKELEKIKKLLKKPKGKKVVKLEGLWKSIEITEEELEEAKHSLFKEAYKFKG